MRGVSSSQCGTRPGSDAELFGEVFDDDGGTGKGRLEVAGVGLQVRNERAQDYRSQKHWAVCLDS
jgi:hypothetical protein